MKRWAAAIGAVLIVAGHSLAEAASLAVVLLIGWAVFIMISPTRTCVVCKGLRRAKRWRWFGPAGKCPKCKGLLEHRRLGATTVHRLFWVIVGERWMGKRRGVQAGGPEPTPAPRNWAEYQRQQRDQQSSGQSRG